VAWILLKLATDLGFVHVMLDFQDGEGKSGIVMEASTQISMGNQATCSKVRVPAGNPSVVMHETMRVKLKMYWEARNAECLPRKAIDRVGPDQERGHVDYKWQVLRGSTACPNPLRFTL
jgi:hypothetical protein